MTISFKQQMLLLLHNYYNVTIHQQRVGSLQALTGRIVRSNLIFGPGFSFKSLFGYGFMFSGLGPVRPRTRRSVYNCEMVIPSRMYCRLDMENLA